MGANKKVVSTNESARSMNKIIISVLGKDRPGIIAAVTGVLWEMDFNIEDVSQTILQSEFSGIFIATGPATVTASRLQAALQNATDRMKLHFHVKNLELEPNQWTTCDCEPFVITTRGPDQKGLVAQVTALLAAHNVNVTHLQAAFRGGDEPGRNIMIYEVDVPLDVDLSALRKALRAKGAELNLTISIQHKNIFEAINRV
jgi:glycine cleavage system transcriptional repressor